MPRRRAASPPARAAAIPILPWPAAEDLVLHLLHLELDTHARDSADHNALPSPSAPAPRGRGTTRSVVEGAPPAEDRNPHYDRDGYCDNPARGY